jgi:hypothetical protein
MKILYAIVLLLTNVVGVGFHCSEWSNSTRFNKHSDIILAHYDCKTDADDIHSAAALATLFLSNAYVSVEYHTVIGTYGIQDGEYINVPQYFEDLFPDNFSDAHNDFDNALTTASSKASRILENDGDVWIAEGGQSDFSYHIVKLLEKQYSKSLLRQRIHIIQHSEWNEKNTTQPFLEYLKTNIDYISIPDGNIQGNGSPGFNSAKYEDIVESINHQKVKEIWVKSIKTAKVYNGQGNRYLNPTMKDNGLDFSDFSEICYILSLEELDNIDQYFKYINENVYK